MLALIELLDTAASLTRRNGSHATAIQNRRRLLLGTIDEHSGWSLYLIHFTMEIEEGGACLAHFSFRERRAFSDCFPQLFPFPLSLIANEGGGETARKHTSTLLSKEYTFSCCNNSGRRRARDTQLIYLAPIREPFPPTAPAMSTRA